MKKLKVGLIGLGEVAQIIHLPILQSLSDRYEIAALCDISPSLLDHMGRLYRVPNLYTDASKLAEQSDLDIVFVLNSDEYHADCAIAAARNKKHVFIEKPMTLTTADADAIIKARDEAGVQVMVGYMRRFAPAFTQAVEDVKSIGKINYARIRDIIGKNHLFINQSSVVHRYKDFPEGAMEDRAARAARMIQEELGDVPEIMHNTYRLMCGLSSHDISAMRELIGMPNRVVSAMHWNNGWNLAAIFEFDGFYGTFETITDDNRRFDAHLEVYGNTKQIRVQYNTPYIRHLPTIMHVKETVGESFSESDVRPTFKDPYTVELEYLYDAITQGFTPKTTPEDYKNDLAVFKMIVNELMKNY